jgi:alcohol dehydrogenase
VTPLPSFSYTAPTIVWFAPGGVARLGSFLKRLGVERAMLVCDPGVRDLAPRVREASGGRIREVFADVEADAPRGAVERGAEAARAAGADGLVAFGGGSAIDTGKAISLLARHGGDVARWDGANKVGSPGIPLVAIPSTAGTGSEASNIAVVKDPEGARKLVLIDRAIYPAVAILDPGLTTGLPPKLTAATGVDALTHAIEGLVSTFHQPICDAIGLECVSMIRSHLPRAVTSGSDLEARGFMLLAASMAGQLVSMTFSGVAHAVAHAMGIGWGIHHGTANAIALPWSVRFNANSAPSAAMYARAARAFGLDGATTGALAFANDLERFVQSLGLPTRLGEVGITRDDVPRLAALAFADPSHGPNPVKVEDTSTLERALVPLL